MEVQQRWARRRGSPPGRPVAERIPELTGPHTCFFADVNGLPQRGHRGAGLRASGVDTGALSELVTDDAGRSCLGATPQLENQTPAAGRKRPEIRKAACGSGAVVRFARAAFSLEKWSSYLQVLSDG
jgi:hypothetical protein